MLAGSTTKNGVDSIASNHFVNQSKFSQNDIRDVVSTADFFILQHGLH